VFTIYCLGILYIDIYESTYVLHIMCFVNEKLSNTSNALILEVTQDRQICHKQDQFRHRIYT